MKIASMLEEVGRAAAFSETVETIKRVLAAEAAKYRDPQGERERRAGNELRIAFPPVRDESFDSLLALLDAAETKAAEPE